MILPILKEYVCLVHGWVDPSVTEIQKRIRVDKKKGFVRSTVSDSGKSAYTELATLAHLSRAPDGMSKGDASEERYSLVALKLHTGRTHQIRVHMLAIGHPLVCDRKYAESRFPADRTWCRRNFLHTFHLSLQDVPEGSDLGSASCLQELVKVYCPLPEDLRGALAELDPMDETSGAQRDAWLSGDTARLCSFEQYAGRALALAAAEVDAKTGAEANSYRGDRWWG